MTHSLVCPETISRVSSVLNRNTRQFGKKHLFDQDEETCWNSDQGPSQWVTLEFPQRICVSQLQIQFQGGFSCHQGRLEAAEVDRLKVTFENTTDFFGRVVIYHLRVLGEKKV
ncbi:nuclear receptor 2C2-associated protein isoform X3 [Vicugna pacos]|uniref:Nuclear receptor 2C2-associated protein isoform X3 n=1 Tax=Vicugna pacos TaxID=30538 RepID=A0ABM5C442_VICPA